MELIIISETILSSIWRLIQSESIYPWGFKIKESVKSFLIKIVGVNTVKIYGARINFLKRSCSLELNL